METSTTILRTEDITKDLYLENVRTYYAGLLARLEEDLGEFLHAPWFFIEGMNVYYDKTVTALFPVFRDFPKKDFRKNRKALLAPELAFYAEGNGLSWDFPTAEEVKAAFSRSTSHPFKFGDYYLKFREYNSADLSYQAEDLVLFYYTFSSAYGGDEGALIGIHRLRGENATVVSDREMLAIWLEEGLTPRDLPANCRNLYRELLSDFRTYALRLAPDGAVVDCDEKKLRDAVIAGKFMISADVLGRRLLNADAERLGLISYSPERVYDKRYGHWDIFPCALTKEYHEIRTDRPLYAGDPVNDIRSGGAVGIDFGPRSTLVSCQSENDYTLPVVLGRNAFSKRYLYENASALTARDLTKFLADYNSIAGRPRTSLTDLSPLSMEALAAADGADTGLITDLTGKSVEGVDYVELYAYYLGSYLNNMHSGIYLDYTLSWTPRLARNIRERILASFTRGIKKSLPLGILSDDDVMRRLNVSYGASRAAAFAAASVSQRDLAPRDDKTLLYGSFVTDAHGADFGFGFVRPSGRRDCDYVLEDYGAYGDKRFGTESVLTEMAAAVLQGNPDVLGAYDIDLLPGDFFGYARWGQPDALYNIEAVKNALRPYLERPANAGADYPYDMANVTLCTKRGQWIRNIPLTLDFEELAEICENAVTHVVDAFFHTMETLFARLASYTNCRDIRIFVGGVGSNHPVITEVFRQKAAEANRLGVFQYTLYPAELNRDYSRANCKTGVSFGLLLAKKGGRIKYVAQTPVEEFKSADDFRYYVGYNNKNKFQCILSPGSPALRWEEVYEAGESTAEIYYTDVTGAQANLLDILQTKRVSVRIPDPGNDRYLYIRPDTGNKLLYTTATREEIRDGVPEERVNVVGLD